MRKLSNQCFKVLWISRSPGINDIRVCLIMCIVTLEQSEKFGTVTDPLTLKRKTPMGKIASLLDYEVVEKLQRRYCSALDPVESSAGRNAKICSGQKF